ncbi:hypothetical protein [Pectobacterium sp. B1J-3]|uniref:hypothetical protein n=1 Tax=Pectobacterium sp. B1J-3 TaxID=3385371 RepID=UPI003905D7B8
MQHKDAMTRFINDTRKHVMTIHRDDGIYRHLKFSMPGANSYRFDLVTWPGYLCVTGDMGTWTFSRLADMFEFFTAPHFGRCESFLINPGYWAEKFEAGAGHSRRESPCYEFDGDHFDKSIKEWLTEYLSNCEDEDDRERAEDAVREVTGNGFRKESDAIHSIQDAFFPDDVSTYDLTCDACQQRPSFHYLWICYAIVWGIEHYRNKKVAEKAIDIFLTFRQIKSTC